MEKIRYVGPDESGESDICSQSETPEVSVVCSVAAPEQETVMELGAFSLSLAVADLKRSQAFYESWDLPLWMVRRVRTG